MLDLFRFSLLARVSHGISTREGGVSRAPYESLNLGLSTADSETNVFANRNTFFAELNVEPERVMSGRLTHGKEVAVFQEDAVRPPLHELRPGLLSFGSDAAVSNIVGLHLFLTFADCVPIAFADRQGRFVGGAHAGWRGTALGIGPEVVRTAERSFWASPDDVMAGIGPSIGPCCYRVGPDVLQAFLGNPVEPAVVKVNGDLHLDLWETNRRQLAAAGVPDRAIEVAGICTACRTDLYYSHRAEQGTTGRFALCIGMP